MVAHAIAQQKSAQTPASNTGSNRHESTETGIRSHLDYLVLTGVGDTEELADIVWAATGSNWDYDKARPGTRGIYYDLILKSSSTIELAIIVNRDDPSFNRYRLSIPGTPLRALSNEQLSSFGKMLYDFGCRATRFDWAIDDYDRALSIDWYEAQGRADSYSGAREFSVFYTRKRGQLIDCSTVYFGSFSSNKLVRCYDKFIESGGKINAIRYEVQYRNELANSMFETLFEHEITPTSLQNTNEYAIGAVTFVHKTSSVLSRCEVVSAWRDFCARVGQGRKLSVQRVVTTVQEKMKWIERQVSGTLALCALCIGLDETLAWIEAHIRLKMGRISKGSNEFFKTFRDKKIVDILGFDQSFKRKRGYDKKQQVLKLEY